MVVFIPTFPILGSILIPDVVDTLSHSPPVFSAMSASLYQMEFSIPMDSKKGLLM